MEKPIRTLHPHGHFYSPVVDPADLLANAFDPWAKGTLYDQGIDFRPRDHETILRNWFPEHLANYDYPEHPSENGADTQFYTQNSQFSWLDARTLFVFLNKFRPQRMIEVGSGYSSLLTADVNRRFLSMQCHFQCIEPYPRPFLVNGVDGISELITQRVQDIPVSLFDDLGGGDVLFIDSSHVCKTGSDVNYLYFEVLPRLKPGVLIHVHDIFLPFEYPKEWVMDENRSWNEQYLLQALLMYSKAFEVFFACMYASETFPDLVRQALALPPEHFFGGGSFWIKKV